jgi:Ca2+:H+ antiporter
MDLAFRPGPILIVVLSVLVTAQISGDGRSNWFKGAELLVVYFGLALTFFFLPS